MTVADFARTRWTDDVPSLATHDDVTTTFDLNPDRLAPECVLCCHGPNRPAIPGKPSMRILYDCWDLTDQVTDVCDRSHADEELAELLQSRPEDGSPRNIRLQLPVKFAPAVLPVPDSDGDEVFQLIDALRRYVLTLPNPGRDEAVETFRNKCLAAVASTGLARIEQLGRAA